MKTYNERTQDILHRAEEKKKLRRKIRIVSVGTICMSILIAFNLILFIPYSTALPDLSAYKDSEYYSVMQQLNSLTYTPPRYKNNFEAWFSGFFSQKNAVGDAGNAPSDEGDGYVEVTNNQEEGVTEGDLFKRTQTSLFYLNIASSDYKLEYYPIRGENTSLAAEYTLSAGENARFLTYSGQAELYLNETGTQATVIAPVGMNGARYTVLIGLDISDPAAISEIGRTYISGEYLSSRYTGGDFLVMNEFFVANNPDFSDEAQFLPQAGPADDLVSLPAANIFCPKNASSARYTVVCRIDGTTYGIDAHYAFLSYTEEMYVSENNIFLTCHYQDRYTENNTNYRVSRTDISCLSYTDTLTLEGTVTVNGSIKDQYSMDEKDGVLRVATSLSETITPIGGYQDFIGIAENAAIWCIDLSDFSVIGSLTDFAPAGDEITAAWFEGDIAYVCTAETSSYTDPVYIIDLSDPANITVRTDTGIIRGYSTTLIPFANGTLLGIGYGETRETLKIELYAETETTLESLDSFELYPCEFSENFKAYFLDSENGYVGLQVRDYNDPRSEYYIFLQFDGYGIIDEQKIFMNGTPDLCRATLIDGFLYNFSEYGCTVTRISQ